MGTPREPKPAKYFIALLAADLDLISRVEADLVLLMGDIDARSEIFPWTLSRFYEKEMGTGLLRRFLSFAPLRSPADLAGTKLKTQQIEEKYQVATAAASGRRVNLDPGYIDSLKVVLASTKNASQRVYLQGGVFAEATLHYHDGCFHGFSYTYPDYLWPGTVAFLTSMRAAYLLQLRKLG